MKQVIQDYKTGEVKLVEIPVPLCGAKSVLVENRSSLVSAGTEKLMMDLAKKSILGKALARPDLVRKVIRKVKTEGVFEAYRQSMARLEEPVLLGYSSAGVVREVGSKVTGFKAGDRVACAGSGHASHGEVVSVPKNLCIKIPKGVGFEEASFVALGAIALHAVRQGKVKIGEKVAVIGVGLLGQIAVQILKSGGADVLAVDLDEEKMELARSLGADRVCIPRELERKCKQFTEGRGADAVIIFASTDSNQPIEQAAEIARERARIVAPGMVGLDLPRKVFYEKELEFVVSRSLGPGVYDKEYEQGGVDYPVSYVRWTEERNMRAFLDLVREGKVEAKPLVTHRFDIKEGLSAYELLKGEADYMGIVLQYPAQTSFKKRVTLEKVRDRSEKEEIGVGLIGAGLFAKGTLLPILKEIKGLKLKWLAAAEGASIRELGKKYGFSRITTDYKKILKDKKVDAVLIATRHNLHARFITESLKAGKEVFCEKPLCLNREELEEIVGVYSSCEGRLMVGFNRRFSPFSRFLKEKFEKVSPLLVSCRVNVGPLPKESWVHDPEVGGGSIIGEVCHFLDLVQYFTGSLPLKVSAFPVSSEKKNIISGDNIALDVEFENGSVGNIVYTTLGNKSFPREKVEIFGGGMVGEIENFKKAKIYTGKGKKRKRKWGVDRGHKKEYASFFQSLKKGKKAPVDFEEYVATTLATFQALASLKEGKPKRVNREKFL